MNFNDKFTLLGKLDIRGLRNRVLAFSEEDWSRENWRQKRFDTHKDTTTIPLIFDEDFRHIQPTVRMAYEALREPLEPVLSLIRRHYNKSLKLKRLQDKHGRAYPVRIILARLRPGGVITPHMDRNFSLTHAHRIHIPLQTHEEVEFYIDGVRNPMKVGEVWEINNRRIHEVENPSPIHRIHLIVDWAIPGERCCCSMTTHPSQPCTPENCKETDYRPTPCSCLA